MHRTAVVTILCLVSGALVAPMRAAETKAAPAESDARAAIERTEAEFVAAWNAHDPQKMASFFAEDGDLINPLGRVAKGRAEVAALLATEQTTMFKGTTYRIVSQTVRMLSSTIAVADWESTVTGMMEANGQPSPPFDHHVTVVLRNTGGQWRVVAARPVRYAPPAGAMAH